MSSSIKPCSRDPPWLANPTTRECHPGNPAPCFFINLATRHAIVMYGNEGPESKAYQPSPHLFTLGLWIGQHSVEVKREMKVSIQKDMPSRGQPPWFINKFGILSPVEVLGSH